MNNTKKGLLAIVAFIVFMVVVSLAYQLITKNYNSNDLNGNQQSANAQVAGDFKVKDSSGKTVSLSDFKGKPVVVNFWASWCPPCKQEMPFFNEVYKEVGSEVQFMMIDIVDGSRETESSAKAFIKDNAYVFPIFFDSDQSAAIANSIYSIPTTIFINKDGKIVGTHTGAFTKSDLLAEIDKIK